MTVARVERSETRERPCHTFQRCDCRAPIPDFASLNPGYELRQMETAMITVTFQTNGGKAVTADENSLLLRVSMRHGGGIPFKCGGGICGTCKCRIEQGLEHTDNVKPRERNHLSDEEIGQGWRMACQTFVNGDVTVSWTPRP